ncbi:hypothetical protein H6764_00745 [Candidatus Nomurabacteria bacterium]|nr:hypothetical protein [Candidatus Nomurabacteria bacterium]
MQYFFIPGRLQDLSTEELKSVLKIFSKSKYSVDATNKGFILVDSDCSAETMREIFNRLGGFVKFGKILSEQEERDFLNKYLSKGRITFGVSRVGIESGPIKVKKLATEIKDYFKQNNVSARYVGGKGFAFLSSAEISGNKVLENGFEIVNLETRVGDLLTGNTVAVQDIDDFTKRDYGRPVADKKMGMLPTKLARIMLNLAELESGSTIWDPFCGSGTILTEALLMGYNALGSDIDEYAVKGAYKNIKWLSQNYNLGDTKYSVFESDVMRPNKPLQKKLRYTSVNAMIFEPYMGPPQHRVMSAYTAEELLTNVMSLYKEIFTFAERINSPNLKAVFVVPSYKTKKGWATIRYNTFLSKRWKVHNREGLHWSRSNSIIRRNILIANLKK